VWLNGAYVGYGTDSFTPSEFDLTDRLAPGSHTITAVYGGDTNFATSTSSNLTQVVNNSATTTSVVTRDVPENAVVGGIPARVLRMRDEPRTLRWD